MRVKFHALERKNYEAYERFSSNKFASLSDNLLSSSVRLDLFTLKRESES